MDYDVELARLLKERNNAKHESALIGSVVSDFPEIKIVIYNGEVLLTKKNLYFTNTVLSHIREVELTGSIKIKEITENFTSTSELTITDTIKKGDQVMLIPTSNLQEFFVIDIVKKLG
ncbi:DUF2577 family protein [Helicovermis profundi]|uniref:DUF2577 domain-containing protein n=1 Tax=Helicovermis profundi TaxID=3065157 RepID=A0AAU9EUQ8_9FIRM|nr:hypothetical protein HLPR_11510 [Clostridia bacterium S502]